MPTRESVFLNSPKNTVVTRGFPRGGSITLQNPQGGVTVNVTVDGILSKLKRHGDNVVAQAGENATAELIGTGSASLDIRYQQS